MIWSALVPFKAPAEGKRRLSERLSPDERARLSLALFERTVDVLRSVPAIGAVHLLSEIKPAGWAGGWLRDESRGLNAEIEAARAALGAVPLLVIHADLPLVDAADVAALLDHARNDGVQIAPDRHGEGTNAIALTPGRAFRFAFGPGSLARHRPQAGDASLLMRPGLALDCDTPDDLDLALAAGFALPWGSARDKT